jgi:uncharacterized repeat protein (TIGR04052 family)
MKRHMLTGLLACTAFAVTLAACSSDDGPGTQDVTITFRPQVGSQAFSCTTTYTDIGTAPSDVQFTDFKLYVSEVRLLTAGGDEVPVNLAQDGTWQVDNVALLDFDDGTGNCEGSPDVNYEVSGTVASGSYTGVAFTLGIPFDLNHGDASTAPAPLNSTDMFWIWNFGYKFLRVDLSTTGQPGGFFVHVGSTGCNGATFTSPPTFCEFPNRKAVTLTGFNATNNVIVVDPKAILAGSDVNVDTGGEPGCMSSQDDAECSPIFSRLGIPFAGAPAGEPQQLFRVAAR